MKFPPLTQMGSYHYLMSEETFTYNNFSQILGSSSTTLTGTYKQPVEMSTLKNSLKNEKKYNIVFYACDIGAITFEDCFKNKDTFPVFLVTPFT